MADIRHNVSIKAGARKVYEAITTQEGIEGWWCKNTIAKLELGFVNVFTFGTSRNEMKVTQLVPDQKTEWTCIGTTEEWMGTTISFELVAKEEERTILRFSHAGWREATDFFAHCSYDWAIFLKSLKSLCETGIGEPA